MINLNAEQHISEAPVVSGEHSTFDRSHGWTGSFNAGKLNCYFIDEMLPGDVVDLRSSFFCRMTTPFYPVYGDCFIDQYFFGVPLRLVWNQWKEFNGENNTSAWVGSGPANVPLIDATSSHRSTGDLAHQMGISPRIPGAASLLGYGLISSMPFRAVRLIENEWFRNQNLQAPKLINFSSSNDTDYTLFDLPDVTRAKDLFGTLLPGTQKGNAVQIALTGYMNVYPTGDFTKNLSPANSDVSSAGIRWQSSVGTDVGANFSIGTASVSSNGNSGSKSDSGYTSVRPIPVNLIADGSHASSNFGINVNDLRQSIALQRTLERWAYSGSRYIETIRAFYHIISPDARQQRPELLAHRRTHVRMLDVTQSAPQVVGQTATPLGTVGAYSKTADNQLAFTASFTEHEYLIGLFCCRHSRSYSQGVPALFERKVFSDFYLPTLAHIGQVPVRKYRIFAEDSGNPSFGNDILGYADAWDDGYRYFESINTGLLDPAAELDASGDPSGLGAVWTYGDFYKSSPFLSASWIVEGDAEIKRTLAIQNEDQFIADVWFDYKHTRPMPTHSVPGLMDHF